MPSSAQVFAIAAGRRAVDRGGEVFLLFRLVDCGVGGRVDHRLGRMGPDRRGAGRGVGQIGLVAAQRDDIGLPRELRGHLAGFTENEDRIAASPGLAEAFSHALPRLQRAPPVLVFEIPVHGARQPFLHGDRGLPAQFIADAGGVDGIAQVVAGRSSRR
jgi:hypothetical protein